MKINLALIAAIAMSSSVAIAQENSCEPVTYDGVTSGCGSVGVPSIVTAGDEITVTVGFGIGGVCGGGKKLWVSHAVAAEILSAPAGTVLTDSPSGTYYFFCHENPPHPDAPGAGTVVDFAGVAEGNHTATVRFTIDDRLTSDQCIESDNGCGFTGPFAVLGTSHWTTARPFTILGNPALLEGTVTDEEDNPLADVTVTLSGDEDATTTTNAEGHYVFDGLESGSYTITPEHVDFAFDPVSRTVQLEAEPVSEIDFVGSPRIEVEITGVGFLNVPGENATVWYDPESPRISSYGGTQVIFNVTVRNTDGTPAADMAVTPGEPSDGWLNTPYMTDSAGQLTATFEIQDPGGLILHDGSSDPLRPDDTRRFVFQADGTASEEIEVPVRNNYAELMAQYIFRTPQGPAVALCAAGYIDWVTCQLFPGVVNNLLWGMNEYACGGYQAATLNFLDRMRLDTEGWNGKWLMNGIQYGPIQFWWGGHQAVVVYHHSRPAAGWEGDPNSRVFDPWPNQVPVVFDMADWVWLIGEFSQAGVGNNAVYPSYPTNNLPYPTSPASLSLKTDPYVGIVIHSPVNLLVEGADGTRFGIDASGQSMADLPVHNYGRFPEEDGTEGTYIELYPELGPFHLTFTGTGAGSVTVDIWQPGEAQPYRYLTSAISGSHYTLTVDPTAAPQTMSNGAQPEPMSRVRGLPSAVRFAEAGSQVVRLSLDPMSGESPEFQVGPTPEGLAVAPSQQATDDGQQLVLDFTVTEQLAVGVHSIPAWLESESGTNTIRPLRIVYDPTAPTTPAVTVDHATDQLTVRWSTEDPDTHIEKVEVALGSSPDDFVMGWSEVGLANQYLIDTSQLELDRSRSYIVYVRATNLAGKSSEVGASRELTLNATGGGGGGCGVAHRAPSSLMWGLALSLLCLRRRRSSAR